MSKQNKTTIENKIKDQILGQSEMFFTHNGASIQAISIEKLGIILKDYIF